MMLVGAFALREREHPRLAERPCLPDKRKAC
jgi:hypothetical protein